jgi:hypothetical protein
MKYTAPSSAAPLPVLVTLSQRSRHCGNSGSRCVRSPIARPSRVLTDVEVDAATSRCAGSPIRDRAPDDARRSRQQSRRRSAPRVVALPGLRGAGKTTIVAGWRDAFARACRARQADRSRAGLALTEIFRYTARHYRRLTRWSICSTAGSPWCRCRRWSRNALETAALLRVSHDDLAESTRGGSLTRVIGQATTADRHASTRPRSTARSRARREPLYARADLTIDTSGLPSHKLRKKSGKQFRRVRRIR